MSVDTDSQNTAVPNRVLHEESLRSSPDGSCPARLSDEYMHVYRGECVAYNLYNIMLNLYIYI